MTKKMFYDWQTGGGGNDVMRMVNALEGSEIPWCAIGGIAVNHWADEPLVTRDVDLAVTATAIDQARQALEKAGFHAETFEWSINFRGDSSLSIQLSTEPLYHEFPQRSVPADVHGILLRVSSLEDTLSGKIAAWRDPQHRASKRIKDMSDIARLVEAHPHLHKNLPDEVRNYLEK